MSDLSSFLHNAGSWIESIMQQLPPETQATAATLASDLHTQADSAVVSAATGLGGPIIGAASAMFLLPFLDSAFADLSNTKATLTAAAAAGVVGAKPAS